MPLINAKDSHGYFYQWGIQKKYYYNPNIPLSKYRAKDRAIKQALAIIYNIK
jgi:hypothetical protein